MLLPVLPCVALAPFAILIIGVAMPLWILALLLTGVAWCVVVPLEALVRLTGGGWLSPARRAIERAWHVLTHPRIPDRWRQR